MMSMTPVRDSTNASPSKQMKSDVAMAKNRSRRSRRATRYMSPTSRLPKRVVLRRHFQLLKPNQAIGGAISSFASGGSGSKYDSAGWRRSLAASTGKEISSEKETPTPTAKGV